jgi:hypothetical protein
MIKFFKWLFFARWTYNVELVYLNDQGRVIATRRSDIGLRQKKTINDHRDIKKLIAPGFIKMIPKRYLCNGKVDVKPICYLGRF